MKRYRQTGFTLLEVLVALSIFALLGVGAYRLLDSSVTSHKRVSNNQQAFNVLRISFEKMERDILQIAERSIRDNYGAIEPAFRGTTDGFVLTRSGWSNPRGHHRSRLQRVQYSLGRLSDKEEPGVLYRISWPVLDRAQDTAPIEQPLVGNVELLLFRYLDHEDNWWPQWPPLNANLQTTPPFPMAIEMELQVAGQGSYRRLLIPGITREKANAGA